MVKKQKRFFPRDYIKRNIIPFFIIVVLISLMIFLLSGLFNGIIKVQCGDGSDYNSCSSTKPYYCNDRGSLIENASFCGCFEGMTREGNSCNSRFHVDSKNITLKYILRGEEKELQYTVYLGMINYISGLSNVIFYEDGEIPFRGDFKFLKIDEEEQRKLLLPLVVKIQNITKDKEEQARIAISIVQNIEWGWSDIVTKFGGVELNYSRHPYEVLYDEKGVCGEKSELLVFLLRELNYSVALFYHAAENHESVGIKCPVDKSLGGTGFCFVETTGPSIITDDSISYVGGVTLKSEPELILISDGLSLDKSMYEYTDAEANKRINEAIDKRGRINPLQYLRKNNLRDKYGLVDTYNPV